MTSKEALEVLVDTFGNETTITEFEKMKPTIKIIEQALDKLEEIKSMIPNLKFHTEKKSAFVGAETFYENLLKIIELLEEK